MGWRLGGGGVRHDDRQKLEGCKGTSNVHDCVGRARMTARSCNLYLLLRPTIESLCKKQVFVDLFGNKKNCCKICFLLVST